MSETRCLLRASACAVALATLMVGNGAVAEPPNERPMFEGQVKTPAMRETDAAFIASIEQQGLSRSAAVDQLVTSGWRSWKDRDPATAMRSFNQAWLLDPANPGAYHGMALVRATRNAPPTEIERLFHLAVTQSRDDPAARVDYGFFLARQERLDDALEQLHAALKGDSAARNARSNIAFVYYLKDDPP